MKLYLISIFSRMDWLTPPYLDDNDVFEASQYDVDYGQCSAIYDTEKERYNFYLSMEKRSYKLTPINEDTLNEN